MEGRQPMGRLFKYLFYLLVLGVIAFLAFSIFSDLEAPVQEIEIPIDLTDK
jgi:hypothetical protein